MAETSRSVVVGNTRAVDGDDATRVLPLPDDTAELPVVLQPVPPAEPAPNDLRPLWAVVAAIALVAVLGLTQGGGGIDVPTPTTAPPSVTSPPPTSTAPPTTAAPVAERPGKGSGKGRDKHDD